MGDVVLDGAFAAGFILPIRPGAGDAYTRVHVLQIGTIDLHERAVAAIELTASESSTLLVMSM